VFAAICLSVASAQNPCTDSCSYETRNVDELKLASAQECNSKCLANPDCAGFSFFDAPSWEFNCFLRADLQHPTVDVLAQSGANPQFAAPSSPQFEHAFSDDDESSSEEEASDHPPHHGHGHHGHHGHHRWNHHKWAMQNLKIANYSAQIVRLIGFMLLIVGLIWGFFERRRRRETDPLAPRQGDYKTGLFSCFGNWRVCIPACLFTPVLAAFNRAKTDERECTGCDVCFAMIKPVAQFTTRQSIRGKYGLEDSTVTDALSACCCTPCAVGQDTLELEHRRAMAAQSDSEMMSVPGEVYPAAVVVPSCPKYEELSVEESKVQDQV
jgi:Cys-rich protein (TIGR01571 family)